MAASPDDTARRLQELVAPRLGVTAAEVDLDLHIIEELGLDSADLIHVIGEIEDQFAPVTLRDQDASEIDTLGQLARYIDGARAAGRVRR